MQWNEAFGKDHPPTPEQIAGFIGIPEWSALQQHLVETYRSQPKYAYSSCSMEPGWNVKFQKGGRSLCTLYPKAGWFLALVVLSGLALGEAEALAPTFSAPVTEQLARPLFNGQQWLMLEVRGTHDLLQLQTLIALRTKKYAA